MEEKTYTYEDEEISVSYDINRCIHAKECVKGLPAVFDPEKRPWIQPEKGSPEDIKEVVERCPTGALHYQLKKGEKISEKVETPDEKEDKQKNKTIPYTNTIHLTPDGPVYFRGDIEVRDAGGEVLLKDARFALCRCGKSDNKPAGDTTHADINFEAHASLYKSFEDKKNENDKDNNKDTRLILKVMKNGPVLVEGCYQIYSGTEQPAKSSKNIALCRCGASSNKPFCDGSHKNIDFEG